jgi:MFS family permease
MNRPLNRPMITLSIMMATIMQTLDSTIANVALPHMQGTLSASQDQIAWVLTAYIVAAAIATPLPGWFVDRFGQKNIFLASISGFTLASVLCGMSNSLAEIVAARLLQGIFGAALVPLSQVVLLDINPRRSGLSHGHLGRGGDGRSDSRAHPGRLADRRLQLALGFSSTFRSAYWPLTASGDTSARCPG